MITDSKMVESATVETQNSKITFQHLTSQFNLTFLKKQIKATPLRLTDQVFY